MKRTLGEAVKDSGPAEHGLEVLEDLQTADNQAASGAQQQIFLPELPRGRLESPVLQRNRLSGQANHFLLQLLLEGCRHR